MLVQLYSSAYMNPAILNKEILDKYGVQTFVAKIGEAIKMQDDRYSLCLSVLGLTY